jgi:ApaG protein
VTYPIGRGRFSGRVIIVIVSVATTNGIRIEVVSRFLPEGSAPRQRQFLFAYHVTIANVGEEVAQLLSRKWIVANADGEVQTVEGPGVVGEQPVIEPGMTFEYTSFCPLNTAFGTMHGTYTMARPDGATFDAEIAPFMLAAPNAVN